MKKIIAVVLCGLIAVMMIGCTAQETEPTPTPTPSAAVMATPTPEPTPTPKPASVVLMDVPEDQAGNFPIPEAYIALDPAADPTVPMNLGYTLYAFTDINGALQYRAFGQKLNPEDQSYAGEQGFYAVTITDEPITAATYTALADGERLILTEQGDKQGEIVDTYIKGDAEKPFDTALFEQYSVIHKVITFDALTAVPVDMEAEAATYMAEEEQPEDGTDDVPVTDSGKSGSGKSGPSGGSSLGAESSSSGSSSSEANNSSSGNGKEPNLEDIAFGDDGSLTVNGGDWNQHEDGSNWYEDESGNVWFPAE